MLFIGEDEDRNHLVRSSAPFGAHVQCAPSYFQGPWDAVVAPASEFFGVPDLRRGPAAVNVLVYGPPHLLRAAWLGGALDYLKDPWTVEELFLRLGGPRPASLEWAWSGERLRLEGLVVSSGSGLTRGLSSAEADILRVLVQRQGTAVSRSVLGWAASCSGGRVVDTLVGRIRDKLRAVAGSTANPVLAVRGLGYRIP